ncbi:unnamed protein product [Lymnaea stagnalis]|uniref:G-protein coupled receptors family 1 profile domain-containing protein n=1 Tax=Lymnaea stagnalis TaxID=6523 RepID=A0AAV2I6L6_LYMST
MASMACTDLIFALFHMPFGVAQLIYNGKWILGTKFCNVWLNIGNDLCGITACHILCIAIDKYMAVCKPLEYRFLTKRIGQLMVILSWFLPSGIFLLPLVTDFFEKGNEDLLKCRDQLMICSSMYNKHVLITVFVVAFYLPMCATYVLYGFIFYEIWKFNKRSSRQVRGKSCGEQGQPKVFRMESSAVCHRLQSSVRAGTLLSPSVQNSLKPTDLDSTRLPRQLMRNFKAIRTLGTIVLCFTICWMPLLVFVVVYVYREYELPMWSMSITFWISYMNSAINPVLYSFFKPIRVTLKRILCSFK